MVPCMQCRVPCIVWSPATCNLHGALVAAEANLGALSPSRPSSSTWCNPNLFYALSFFACGSSETSAPSHTSCEFNFHFAALSLRSSGHWWAVVWVRQVLQYTRCPDGRSFNLLWLLKGTLIMHDPVQPTWTIQC